MKSVSQIRQKTETDASEIVRKEKILLHGGWSGPQRGPEGWGEAWGRGVLSIGVWTAGRKGRAADGMTHILGSRYGLWYFISFTFNHLSGNS